jgi:hypothetical protein
MFIGLLKTKDNQVAREHDTFEDALSSLNRRIDEHPPGSIKEALILEETEYLDDQFPDFDSCRLVASLRTCR